MSFPESTLEAHFPATDAKSPRSRGQLSDKPEDVSTQLIKLKNKAFYQLRKRFLKPIPSGEGPQKQHTIAEPTGYSIDLSNRFDALVEEEELETIEPEEVKLRAIKSDTAPCVIHLESYDQDGPEIIKTQQKEYQDKAEQSAYTEESSEEMLAKSEALAQIRLPDRAAINRTVRKRKWIKVYEKLYFYLKCKYFMRTRDPAMINNMVADARIWLTKSSHKCESSEDYLLLTSSVSGAFMVDDNELEFRAMIKNDTNWDNTTHLNKTLKGDLGAYFGPLKFKEHTLIGSVLPNARFPSSSAQVVNA